MLSMDRGSNVNTWVWRKKENDKIFNTNYKNNATEITYTKEDMYLKLKT